MKVLFYTFFYIILTVSINAQEVHFLKNTIIIKLKSNPQSQSTKSASINTIKQAIGSDFNDMSQMFNNSITTKQTIPERYNIYNIYKITLKNSDNYNTILQNIKQLYDVEYAESYPISIIFDTPNDPLFGNQYYLNKIKTIEAHAITKGDTNIVIGIVDSGVDLLHEDLKGNYKYNYNDPINNIDDDMDGYIDNYYGWDVADNNNNPQSVTDHHGTRVAGMASATANNSIGIYSIGYNTKILPIKAMDASGHITAGYEGIIYAADHGCQIINCSWGSNYPSKFAQDVINYAAEYRNCLIIAAAGNKSSSINKRPDTWWYPASYKNVLSVAATGPDDIRWIGTSYATTVDVCAPGENAYTTNQNNTYSYGFGTSYASPLVAGLAALLKAQRPELTQQQLAAHIRITSDNIDTIPENNFYNKQLGYGRLNAFKALSTNNSTSIIIDSFNITTNSNQALYSGDTLLVTFTATNILSHISNSIIRLVTNSEYIEPINNFFNTGGLNTFASTNNSSSPLSFKIKTNIPTNEKIWFTFEMKAENYDDYQIFETVINRSYININENNINTTLTSNGKLGFAGIDNKFGIGLNNNGSENLMKHGGIIVGLNSTQIASSLFDIEEFTTTNTIDTSRNSDDILIGESSFATIPNIDLPISITQKTIADTTDLKQSTITYSYTLINITNNIIEDMKMSQFVDWDLYDPNENSSDYVDYLNLFYTYSTGNHVVYSGICLLNNTSSTPYGFDLVPGGNGGVDITDGFSNNQKWFTMNNSRPQDGVYASGKDVANMLTTDFFNIEPKDTIEIAFAHIIADNYNDLINKTIAIKEAYNKQKPNDTTSIANSYNSNIKIFPNPTKGYINIIRDNNPEKIIIDIYDTYGKLQLTNTYYNKSNILLNISKLNNGIYILNYKTDTETQSIKLIKTH